MALKVKKLDPRAQLPMNRRPGEDLGFDLASLNTHRIPDGETHKVRTGIAIEHEFFGFEIRDRSSQALRGLSVVGGIIDRGYTGEIFVNIFNHSGAMIDIQVGERIGQLIPRQVANLLVEEVSELSPSDRGEKGYGSSGR